MIGNTKQQKRRCANYRRLNESESRITKPVVNMSAAFFKAQAGTVPQGVQDFDSELNGLNVGEKYQNVWGILGKHRGIEVIVCREAPNSVGPMHKPRVSPAPYEQTSGWYKNQVDAYT